MNFYSIRPEFQYWFLSLASLFLFFSWCSVWTATNPASQLTVLSALSQLLPESFAFPSSSNNLMTNLLLKDYENLYITTMIFFRFMMKSWPFLLPSGNRISHPQRSLPEYPFARQQELHQNCFKLFYNVTFNYQNAQRWSISIEFGSRRFSKLQ